MKKILIQIIASFMLIGCADHFKKEELIGMWVVEETEIEGDISKVILTDMKDAAQEVPPKVYHFQDDNKLTLTSIYHPNGLTGNYELELDSNLLILHFKYDENANVSNERFKIIELKEHTMKWYSNMGELGINIRLKRK